MKLRVICVEMCFRDFINYVKISAGPILIMLLGDQNGCWGPNNSRLLHLIIPKMKYSCFTAVWLLDKPQIKLSTIYQMKQCTKTQKKLPSYSLTLYELTPFMIERLFLFTRSLIIKLVFYLRLLLALSEPDDYDPIKSDVICFTALLTQAPMHSLSTL